MTPNLKILILEDNKSDADLLLRELKKSGLTFTSEIIQTRETYENALQNFNPDIILSDYSLPAFDAVTAFHIKQNKLPHIPFIIVSGIIGEENAVELIKLGVTDYAPKDKLFTLGPKITRALKESQERKEKIVIDEQLKIQTAKLIIANNKLIFQNREKENRASELQIANIELAFQNDEKESRAAELYIANAELAFQSGEKERRAAELHIANRELVIQNEENEKRATDLVTLSGELQAEQKKLKLANVKLHDKTQLLIEQDERVKIINRDLLLLNQELEARVIHRTKELADSETRFRNMMETIPQIAWTNTTTGSVTFYNKRWYDYTGLECRKVDLPGWQSIIPSDDLRMALGELSNILKTSDGGGFQTRLIRSDGEYRWHLIRLMSIKNEEDEVQLWVGTATDIHELRLLQQQKDDFISIASHELKTPITTLKATLQLLNKIKDDPSHALFPKLISQANKSLDKVTILIDDLLNTTMVNEGKLNLHLKSFNLAELINECCHHVRMEGIYNIITKGDVYLNVYADADRINQVMINLVNNAIKYAPDSKIITVHIEQAGDMAKVSVADTGPGVIPDKLTRLFDRYYRVEGNGIQGSGLGLGLYISSEIIKKHSGQIGVDSELGRGSTFWFTLPVAINAPADLSALLTPATVIKSS
ncbi:MAG TPA: ATP-binding protein [Mucilaginibacter sp.]|jgi:PAS domain S-box-containing protein|nr:ATP-binding protein [Mucilaginibacter sp.]